MNYTKKTWVPYMTATTVVSALNNIESGVENAQADNMQLRGDAASKPAASATTEGRLYIETDSPYKIWRDNGAGWDHVGFAADVSGNLRIVDGKIGVGTITPLAPLHISRPDSDLVRFTATVGWDALQIQSSDAALSASNVRFAHSIKTGAASLQIYGYDGATFRELQLFHYASNAVYFPKLTGAFTTPTLTIDMANIRVGIGTGIPAAKLHIVGRAIYLGDTVQNIGLGVNALEAGPTGVQNIAIGWESGKSITTGNYNLFLGVGAGRLLSTGDKNIAIGTNALNGPTDTKWNTALGIGTLRSLTTGYQNVMIGEGAGYYITSGKYNLGIGTAVIGGASGPGTGDANIAIGDESMRRNTSGEQNIAIGMYALMNNLSGKRNISIGYDSMRENASTTDDNVAIGHCCLTNMNVDTASGFNVAVGSSAGRSIITGRKNTFIGALAGYTGTPTTVMGSAAIGYNAQVTQDNSIILGGTGVDAVRVGIGTTAPATSALLELLSTTGALLLPRLTTVQEAALTAVNGMVIYNTDNNRLEAYENGAWVDL